MIAAIADDRQNLVYESADLLYHLLVVLKIADVPLRSCHARASAANSPEQATAKRPTGGIHDNSYTGQPTCRNARSLPSQRLFALSLLFVGRMGAVFAPTPR